MKALVFGETISKAEKPIVLNYVHFSFAKQHSELYVEKICPQCDFCLFLFLLIKSVCEKIGCGWNIGKILPKPVPWQALKPTRSASLMILVGWVMQ